MSECQQDTLRVRCLLCCQILECNRIDTTALVYHIRDVHPEVTLQSSDEIQTVAASLASLKQPSQAGHDSTKKNIQPDDAQDINQIEKISSEPINLKEENRRNTIATDVIEKVKEIGKEANIIITRPKSPSLTGQDDPDSSPTKQQIIVLTSPSKTTECHQQSGDGKETQVLYKRQYKFKHPLSYQRPGKRKLYKTSIEKWRPGKSTIVCPECGANKRPMIKSQIDKVSHSPIGAAFILTCWPFCFLPCLFPPPTKEYLHCAVCNHFLGIYDRNTEVINPNPHSLRKSGGGCCSSSSDVAKTEQLKAC